MPYRSMFIIVVALLISGVAEAQEDKSQKWYWAWRESTQELFAYTADGQVNTILRDVPIDQIWLGEGNTAVALMLDDEKFGFYVLTSREAIPIKADFDIEREVIFDWSVGLFILQDIRFGLVLQRKSYFLIHILQYSQFNTSLHSQYILIDTNKQQAELTDSDRGYYFVLSEGGQSIYYADKKHDTSTTHQEWELWEVKLATGTERLIYKHSNPLPTATLFRVDCNPNINRDQWLCRSYAEFDKSFRYDYWLVNSDGTTQSIVENSNSNIQLNILLAGDSLVLIDGICESECHVKVYPKGETIPILFAIESQYLPLNQNIRAYEAQIIQDDVLLFSSLGIFRLSQDGRLKYLGEYFCCEIVHTLSPDHRWIVVANTKSEKTQVWNLEENRIEFEYPLAEMVTAVDYFERGFAITQLYSTQSWVYLYSTNQPVEIIGDESAFVIDILPDDTLLIDDRINSGANKEGIYRFDPQTNQYTLLIAQAHEITYR